jgi:hypothetical protein
MTHSSNTSLQRGDYEPSKCFQLLQQFFHKLRKGVRKVSPGVSQKLTYGIASIRL